MTPRRRRRAKYCARCGGRTFPSLEDKGRCFDCFAPYANDDGVLHFPSRLRVTRDDDPNEAA